VVTKNAASRIEDKKIHVEPQPDTIVLVNGIVDDCTELGEMMKK